MDATHPRTEDPLLTERYYIGTGGALNTLYTEHFSQITCNQCAQKGNVFVFNFPVL